MVIVEMYQIPVFVMKDGEESYVMNWFAILHVSTVIVWKINLTLPKICVKIFAYVTMDGKVITVTNVGLTGIVQIKKIMPAMSQMNAYAIHLTKINFVQKNISWLKKLPIQSFSKMRNWCEEILKTATVL